MVHLINNPSAIHTATVKYKPGAILRKKYRKYYPWS